MGVWPCVWWRHRWMSDWRGGIRGFEALLRAACGVSQDFEGKTKKRLFLRASVTRSLLHTPHSCSHVWRYHFSHHWLSAPAVSGCQRLQGSLLQIQMHWVWRASTLEDRILFRAAILDRTIWDADHPPHRVVPTRVLGLSQSIGIDCIQGKEFRQSFIGAPMLASGGGKNKKQVALLTCQGGGTLIPYTGWGYGCVQGSCWRGGLGGLPTPLWCLVEGDFRSQHPVFCSPLFRNGSWMFFCLCICWSRICPNCASTGLFLVPCSLFVFCCWRRGMSGANFAALQLRVPGPNLSQGDWWVSLTSPSETTSDRFPSRDTGNINQERIHMNGCFLQMCSPRNSSICAWDCYLVQNVFFILKILPIFSWLVCVGRKSTSRFCLFEVLGSFSFLP